MNSTDLTDREKSRLFRDDLQKYNSLLGKEPVKVPHMAGKELDLFKLFSEVTSRGGYNLVLENKQWKDIVTALEISASCTSASYLLRSHYSRYLLAYEQNHLKSNALSNQQLKGNGNYTNLSLNPDNQQSSNPNTNNSTQNSSSNYINPTSQQEQRYLGKKVVKPELDYSFFFRHTKNSWQSSKDKSFYKKIRLMNAIPDLKRVVLAFESHITSEVLWSLNVLQLFSANTNVSLVMDNQPYLIESMTNYMYYCVNNIPEFYYLFTKVANNNTGGAFNNINLSSNESQNAKSGNIVSAFETVTTDFSNTGNALSMNRKPKDTYESNTSINSNPTSINQAPSEAKESIHKSSSKPNHHIPNSTPSIKPFNSGANYNFTLDINVNKTVSLPFLGKKEKNLSLKEKVKETSGVFSSKEEVMEYELMEQLLSLLQIFRNLSMMRANEPSIIKNNKLMNLIYSLLINTQLIEIKVNCLDIICNLSKHIILKDIKHGQAVLRQIFELVKSNYKETSEQAIECLRRLTFPVGNEEFFVKFEDDFYEEMVNLLISYKQDIRESVLEILYCVSDQIVCKSKLGKQIHCIERLIALLCSNSQDNRIAKFSACILSNLATLPYNQKMIMAYEEELFLAACLDETLTKSLMAIISN